MRARFSVAGRAKAWMGRHHAATRSVAFTSAFLAVFLCTATAWAGWAGWCAHWKAQATRWERQATRASLCFKVHYSKPKIVLTGVAQLDGMAYKAAAIEAREDFRELRYRMCHPKPLHDAGDWAPLIRWHWPGHGQFVVRRLVRIVRHESHGLPWKRYDPSNPLSATGLFQILPGSDALLDPDINCATASRYWHDALRMWGDPWRPWAGAY